MKYFYQQLLAFSAVILLMGIVSGVLYYSQMRTTIYQNKTEELYRYARMLIQHSQFHTSTVETIEEIVLIDKDVDMFVYDESNQLLYMTSSVVPSFESVLSQEDNEKLQAGIPLSLREVQRTIDGKEVNVIIIYYPVMIDQQYQGFIVIGAPISPLQKELIRVQGSVLSVLWLAAGISILMSTILARYQTRRINKLRKAAHVISNGDFSVVVPSKNRDELDDLANDFNHMTHSLQESHKEIYRQERLRRRFIMDVAHEMRTPLTTMNGLVEGIRNHMIPEDKQERSLELISMETQRLIRLVNENLDYEKIRSNQITLHKQLIDVESAFKSIMDQTKDLVEQKQLACVSDVEPDMKVFADYDRFIQIMMNLVKNSIQFTNQGTIRLTAYVEEQAIIKIEDTGIGIAEHELPSIWERFYKVDPSRKSVQYGESGIGLAIVRSLVEAHQGTITVESTLGVGTTFTIYLPHKEEN